MDFPQPDGPTIAMNSPYSGTSSIRKLMSLSAVNWVAAPGLNVLVTPLNSMIGGDGAHLFASR